MCNSVKAVSAPIAVVKSVDTVNPGHRVADYVESVVKARGLDTTKWNGASGGYYHQRYNGTYELAINRTRDNDFVMPYKANMLNVSIPALAKFIGVEPQYLYDIGDGNIVPPPAKVEPAKLKTRILPGGIKRYVHVFAPALKERFDGKAKDNPLCCVRVGSNPKRFKMYRGVEFLSGASLEELAEPLAGTNGRAICVMVTTGPIRVSY